LSGADICFLATSKSGLGHLRRVGTIAGSVKEIAPGRRLHLISNARPEGLPVADLAVFDTVQVTERADMAQAVPTGKEVTVVLDTITVPGIERLNAPLALVLREAPDAQLHRFRLAQGRPWDLAIIANPKEHWMPSLAALSARRAAAVGWIYRSAGVRRQTAGPVPTVLVATGGGGTAETARALYGVLDGLLAKAKGAAPPFTVVQAIGPRALAFGRLAAADRTVDPGPQLNDLFRDADIVISTAGYNSVLELATTDTPTLLVPIPRSIDDQEARASLWAAKLGCWYDARSPEQSVKWLAQEIALCRRRPPVDLCRSGEDAAARAILALG
jgi:predicted glycosyltransferase